MVINLKKYNVGLDISHKITFLNYCCEFMDDCSYIELGTDYDCSEPISICIMETVPWSDGSTMFNDVLYHEIKFCPFCGKPILLCVTETEDITKIYDDLQEEQNILIANAKTEDSISKRDKLMSEARLISKKLDEYLTTDSIHNR